ncbi:GEVED domain-containing protein [uncultured Dokdonia sp.]|uniref:GEVED domain-containing protein n=1 Tax=uncultured Dokdonia sp. TaxID=575653 RepID=UPI00261E613C|nr:GEVED domain-containing protein [uncultured Dokdonia sp.]
MKKSTTLFVLMLFISLGVYAQETQGPSSTSQAIYKGKTVPLRDFATLQNHNFGIEELTIVPNRYEGSFENLVEGLSSSEATLQREMGPLQANNAIEANFPGINGTQSGFIPPDPTGAVGPNHYAQAVNSAISIYDKTGGLLVGPVALGTFLGNNANNGDPIILYDQLADRWLVSQFGAGALSLVVGISETADPTGSYNVYEFLSGQFEDYPHYSVWPDGYYLTTNGTGGGGGFNPREVFVLERDVMLAGGSDPQIVGLNLTGQFANPTTIFSAASANLTGYAYPDDTPGFFVYLQDDSWNGNIDADNLLVWEANIDWDNTANSTISANPQEILVDSFDSLFAPFGVGDIDQPSTDQDLAGQGGIISYMANYRTFEDHNSWVITFNVDVDGNNTSGIRWIELRNTEANTTWSVFQEGTFAPDDGNSRFMSSAAMDAQGNIGLAYNIAGSTMPVGIRHTGRFATDPLGQMTVEENIIFDGPGVQTFSNRFGDYAHMTLDPNEFTFWHTTQYFQSNNVWATRIASFRLSDGFATDVGVNGFVSPSTGDLTATETVEVIIRNFGTEDQSNIPLELRLDDVLIANETFTGTILAGDSANYVFTATVDLSIENQTYVVSASTLLDGDQQVINNDASIEVTHLFANDIGVAQITSPTSGMLGVEDVTIDITNYGGAAQSNFDVQYILDDGSPVVETFTGNVPPLATVSFTFAEQADISEAGNHTIVSKTNLSGDQDTSNDEASINLLNICMPIATNGCNIDGIKQFVLNTISADDGGNGCNTEPDSSPQGYANRTNLSTTLSNVAGQNEYILQAQQNWAGGPGVEVLSVWIDFNDNGDFETSEQLIAGEFFQQAGVLEDFNLVIPPGSPIGSHILRAKAIDSSASGDINNACSSFAFGEVQDYTVIIDDTLGLDDMAFANSTFTIATLDNEYFDVALTSTLEGNVFIGVYNSLGQQLKYKKVQKEGNTFRVALDMSNVASGVYFVKMMAIGSSRFKTEKILVK